MATSNGWDLTYYKVKLTKEVRNTKLARKVHAKEIVSATDEWLTIEYYKEVNSMQMPYQSATVFGVNGIASTGSINTVLGYSALATKKEDNE
jgi:hypothetical protein